MTEVFFAKDSWKTEVVKLGENIFQNKLAALACRRDVLDGQHDLLRARLLYRRFYVLSRNRTQVKGCVNATLPSNNPTC